MAIDVKERREGAARPADDEWTHDDSLGVDLPKGHIGPVLLSETGRAVWWTGRVAIGLRYEAPRQTAAYGESARWVQRVLLACA